jgi:hypothetical protein
MKQIKEFDVIETVDGRIGTVVLIHRLPCPAYEVEFTDKPGETEAVKTSFVKKIVWES